MSSPAWKPRWVSQDESHGCGVACIAMLAGWGYSRARREFVAVYGERRAESLTKGGITYVEIDTVLAERAGLAVARHWRGPSDNRRNPWPPEPFGPAHLVQAIQPTGAHFVVMHANGDVLDPATDPAPRSLSDYKEVQFVAAVVPVLIGMPDDE